jgi:hypothetical protein
MTQAHASLLNEITNPGGLAMTSDEGRMSPHSEDADSGWWSDGREEDDDETLTVATSITSNSEFVRGSSAGNWIRRRSGSPEGGEVKILRKENIRLREEVERLEGVLEDCSIVLGGMDGMRR